MQDTLSKTEQRRYAHSSSFKMAMFFTAMLGVAMILQIVIFFFMPTDMRWLSILSVLLMVIVIAASFVISIFVVNHTNHIALTAKEIMDTGDLSRRITIDSRWDDLSNMAYVLNAFLERIESLMQGIRQVSDNIAHDLRTPLTRLRNNLEILRSQDPNHDMQPAYDIMIEEADHLLNTFNALLRIARIETGKQKTQFVHINLKKLVCDVIDLYEPLAQENHIHITSDLSEAQYHGDRDLIFQALANILDNAIKFTPTNGAISIKLTWSEGRCLLTIRDSGPGIPEAEQDKVFDRFYRSETSRTRPGNGLGLSLVEAVVHLHSGSISLRNLSPGLEIRLML